MRLLSLAIVLCISKIQADTCGNSSKYYPSFNASFPSLNATEGFDIAQLIMPNTKTSVCVEQPIANEAAESARYYCNGNGTMLHYLSYNTSGCTSLSDYGAIEVPFEVDGIIVDCLCKTEAKYATVQMFDNSSDPLTTQCSSSFYDKTYMLSGSCFGYYDDSLSSQSISITCNDNDEAEVLQYSNSLNCDPNSLVLNATYADGECVNSSTSATWMFACSGGGTGKESSTSKTSLAKDDVIFLVIAFLYLVFVIILLSIMGCYMTGKICVKRNKVGIEPENEDNEPIKDEKVVDEVVDHDYGEAPQYSEVGEAVVDEGLIQSDGGEVTATSAAGAEQGGAGEVVSAGVEGAAVSEQAYTEEGTAGTDGAQGDLSGVSSPDNISNETAPVVAAEDGAVSSTDPIASGTAETVTGADQEVPNTEVTAEQTENVKTEEVGTEF